MLKKRFALGRDYSYYASKIAALRMKQDDTVSSFYDHINILVSAARNSMREMEHKNAAGETVQLSADQLKLMILPLLQSALDTFTRGLPADIAQAIVIKGCTTFEDAYAEVLRYECKMDAKIIPDTRYCTKNDNSNS